MATTTDRPPKPIMDLSIIHFPPHLVTVQSPSHLHTSSQIRNAFILPLFLISVVSQTYSFSFLTTVIKNKFYLAEIFSCHLQTVTAANLEACVSLHSFE